MKYDGFSGKLVMITGASKGIGKAIAEELLKSDCRLILSASSEKSFDGASFPADKVTILPIDMSSAEGLDLGLKLLKTLPKMPEILINNAGIGIFKNFKDFKQNDFDKMLNVNYRSPFMLTQALLPSMIEAKFGVVANILSVAAVNNFLRSSAYGASKAALLEAMKTLRMEVRSEGLNIINFLPGATETSIWSEKVRQEMGHRMMQTDNLARVIVGSIDNAITNGLAIEEMIIRPLGGDL